MRFRNDEMVSEWPEAKVVAHNQTIYRCEAGHELPTTTYRFGRDDSPRIEYHYCHECFCKWAQENWPLKRVTP
jgi:hypothetical protein